MKKYVLSLIILLLFSSQVFALDSKKGYVSNVYYDKRFKSYSLEINVNDENYIFDVAKGKYNSSKLKQYVKKYNHKKVTVNIDYHNNKNIYDDEIISIKL